MTRRNMKLVPLGERQRIRMLALLSAEGPMSAADIGARLHMTSNNALNHIKVMRSETPRRAYIAWHQNNGSGSPTPMYAAGDRPDTVYTREEVIQSHHQHLLGRVVAELEISPRTNRELSELIGLSLSGMRMLVQELRKMGWCKIVDWVPAINRNSAPIFGLGIGKDKKKVAKTSAQRWKEVKADDDMRERVLAKRRARDYVVKALKAKKPASVFAALAL